MKRLVFCSILMIMVSMKSYSQTDTTKGILFEHGLSWQEVLKKAKKENKCVFIDCYATWCGPCKWMDKEVYPVDSIGTFMSEKFISVRVQMDSTGQDKDETRQWYATARAFGEKYHLGAYPSYLFFSPDGQAVHKDVGEKDIKDFLSMVKAALDPQQQYYTLRANFRNGGLAYTLMPVLANAASRVGQDSLSRQVSRDYIHNYLETLPEAQLWTKENILFVEWYSSSVNAKDKLFQLFYHDRGAIDSIMHDKHFSDGLINEILYRDEVKSRVDKALIVNAEPNWHHLGKAISTHYDEFYAKKNVLQGRVEYYKTQKRWKKYIEYFIQEQEMNGIEAREPGIDATFDLNNDAFQVFEYSKNRRELRKALSWVNNALTMTNTSYPKAEEMDTKANLLYKLGKRSEALSLEEKSHALAPHDKDITADFEKMKNGLPTWVTE